MTRLQTFTDVNKRLAQFVSRDQKTTYSLERIRLLMEFLGNPQNNLKVIHVAGTSGKTSTSYYIAALLQSLGKKVGLSVSPHVIEVNERLQINLIPLPETEYCQELDSFLDIVAQTNIALSYFELLVAFAYWEFDKKKVDYAVIEVGLGGLLDGTNVISNKDKVCVITDIGLDHVRILGNTLKAIAAQKAGIIQPGNVVFAYRQGNDVVQSIKQRVQQQKAELHLVEQQGLEYPMTTLPLFQQRNFELSKNVVEYVVNRDSLAALTDKQLVEGSEVHIPGRMETFTYNKKSIIIDGAHNSQKLQALVDSVKNKYPDQAIAALVSFSSRDSDIRLKDSLVEITNIADYIIATEFMTTEDMHQYSVDPNSMRQVALELGYTKIDTISDPKKAFAALLLRPEPVLLVTGSLYLLNHIRPLALGLEK